MTATSTAPAAPRAAVGTSHRLRRARRSRAPLLAAAAVVVLAAVLRLWEVARSYDIFVDEVSYADLTRSVATGQGVLLHGEPFNLHPPGVFWLLAPAVRLLGLADADPASVVLGLRPVEAVLGALTCGLLLLLLARVVRLRVAVGAALLLALDPFLIRFDSRVMLEAPSVLAAVLGLLLLTRVLGPDARRSPGAAVAAGVALGAAVLGKDTLGLVTVAPVLLLALVLPARRRALLTAAASACGVYLAYLVWVVLSGGAGPWLAEKGSGFARLAGADQQTGFNVPGAVPLTSKLAELVELYLTTYVLIGAGVVVGGWLALTRVLAPRLARRVPPARRLARGAPLDERALLLLAWLVCATLLLGYAVGFGTLEEQMFYLLLAPALAALALGVELALQRAGRRGGRRAGLRTGLLAVALLAGLVLDGRTWAQVHTTPDDGYRQLLAWTAAEVPDGSRVAVTEGTAQFLLPGVVLGDWSTPAELQENDAEYVVVSTELTAEGFGSARPALLAWLEENAVLVQRTDTPSLGGLLVYQLPQAAPAR